MASNSPASSSNPINSPQSFTTNSNPPITTQNPISGTNFSGTNLTIPEILALPEHERDELAKKLNVISWDPFTVQAIGTPGDVYSHLPEDLPNPEDLGPIPDEDDGEELGNAGKEDVKGMKEQKAREESGRGERGLGGR